MKKSELYAYIGTAISGIIILLILLFVYLPGLKIEGDDGIMISFGDAFSGGGSTETSDERTASSSPQKKEIKEEIITQEDESVPIPDNQQQTEPTPSKEEQRRKQEEQMAQQAADLIGGSFGASETEGSGLDSGDEIAGNPVGSGTAGGHSWSLSGRNLLGTMPTPIYNENEQGYLTIRITVDAKGKVISATIIRGTISNQTMRDAAISAAKRTQFSSGASKATGSITYNFKLR